MGQRGTGTPQGYGTVWRLWSKLELKILVWCVFVFLVSNYRRTKAWKQKSHGLRSWTFIEQSFGNSSYCEFEVLGRSASILVYAPWRDYLKYVTAKLSFWDCSFQLVKVTFSSTNSLLGKGLVTGTQPTGPNYKWTKCSQQTWCNTPKAGLWLQKENRSAVNSSSPFQASVILLLFSLYLPSTPTLWRKQWVRLHAH